MDKWLVISILFIGLTAFLILIIWIDWIFKCRKSAKDNKLETYLVCYWIVKNKENKNEIFIIDGILGLNAVDLVYANRFKDDALYMKEELSDIVQFDISHYDEKELLNFIYMGLDENEEIRYVIRNMTGHSFSKRIPKLIKARTLCKIGLADGYKLYFYYKNTLKNAEIVKMIKESIRTL